MAHNGADMVCRKLAGPLFNFGVAKAVKGKTRFPRFAALAAQGIAVGGLCRAQGSGRELAVLQDVGMTESDGVSRRYPYGQAQPADQVLTEIEDSASSGGSKDSNRRNQFHAAHRRTERSNERVQIPCDGTDSLPIVVIITGVRPADAF